MRKYIRNAPILIVGFLGEAMFVGGLVLAALAITQ